MPPDTAIEPTGMDPSQARLRRGTVIGISTGEFGLNVFWQTISLYLLYFYTDVVRAPPALAGAIYMAALIWDAILDLVVGAFADNVRSRMGRYRPYLTIGAVPLALSFVALFVAPIVFQAQAIALIVVTQLLFRTSYAVVSVPYTALSARVTRQSHERSRIAAIRILFGAIGGIVVAASALPVADAFGQGRNDPSGWIVIACAYAVAGLVALLVAAQSSARHDATETRDERPPHLRDKLRAVLTNRPLLIVLAAIMLAVLSSAVFQKGIIYYFKYAVGNVHLAAVAVVFMAVIIGTSAPLWAAVSHRLDKRRTVLIGMTLKVAGISLWWLSFGEGVMLMFIGFALIALGTSASLTSLWAMVPDTVEYGEWRSGVRSETLAFGIITLGQKLAIGAGVGTLGLFLSNIGYVADAVQSPATIGFLRLFLLIIPLVSAVAIGGMVAFYRLGPGLHQKIVAEIAVRQKQD